MADQHQQTLSGLYGPVTKAIILKTWKEKINIS